MSVNISDSDSDMPPEQPPERVDYEKNFLAYGNGRYGNYQYKEFQSTKHG